MLGDAAVQEGQEGMQVEGQASDGWDGSDLMSQSPHTSSPRLPASARDAAGSEASDMDDFQEASSEVEGIPPRLHLLSDPAIAVNVPVTQVCCSSECTLCSLSVPH